LSLRDYLSDLGKILEGGLSGDPGKVRSYAEHLRDRLKDNGEDDAAKRIDRVLHSRSGRIVKAAQAHETSRIPVDSESRLPMAEVEEIDDEASAPVLSESTQASVDRLVRYIQAAGRLSAEDVQASASVLLYGPPGCGKTMLARHIAHRLGLPLITARIDTLISSYLGSTSKNLRLLFEHAMSRPCILFLDEFDALGKMRDDSQELGELKRVVISLLQNIDAMGSDHVLVAATNHEHLLDRAIWRRFNYKLQLTLPDRVARETIIRNTLRDRCADDTPSVLSYITPDLSGAELREVCVDALRAALLDGKARVDEKGLLEAIHHCRPTATQWAQLPTSERVAHLLQLSGHGLTQEQVGRLVGVSQSRVSKILGERENTDAE
jgi:SpoVK/Ycf46/Vps4 family AAA+-type ATPase